ncbi:hypothetical protein [Allopontixanthobacter sediminis]|uniref:Uncharacterized protein n=1 Tax=Allopontixanthobacter sediminis TaxID=1689985 RepID=A0A845B1J9_9SPHN|nr:hypothetical protein [Allopontixanthobacter sediminis]MXP45131.1 hypothetical protein [Allopontixanthobacter sediminis]
MKLMRIRPVNALTLGFALTTLAAVSPPAAAQDAAATQGGENVEYLDLLKSCQAEAADSARLACFDSAVSRMLKANEEGDLQVVDRADVRETRRKFFGLSVPDLGIFKKRDESDTEELEVLQSTITSATRTRQGWVIQTAEGALWQIDEAPRRLLDPEPGQPVEFRKAALGSYFIRVNDQLGVKGRRIR